MSSSAPGPAARQSFGLWAGWASLHVSQPKTGHLDRNTWARYLGTQEKHRCWQWHLCLRVMNSSGHLPPTWWCQILAPQPQGRDREFCSNPLILAPHCHTHLFSVTIKSSQVQNHMMGDQLNICSLSHQLSWEAPQSSLATPRLSVMISTNLQQQLFQMPTDVTHWVASEKDSSSAGVNQPQPSESTSWRFCSKLAFPCLTFHKLQIQPHFKPCGFFWALICCANVLLTLFFPWYVCYISTHAPCIRRKSVKQGTCIILK